MNRRKFLGGGVLLGSVVALPPLIRRAFFAGEAATKTSEEVNLITKGGAHSQVAGVAGWLSSQFEAARSLGKPLLILLVPEKERYDRGHAWGELLNHGSEAQLATLALCEVVCASFASVKEHFQLSLEPKMWAVLLETNDRSSCAAAPAGMPTYQETLDKKQGEADALIAKRISLLSAMLKEMLAGSDEMISRRVEQSVAEAPAEIVSELRFNLKQEKSPTRTTLNRFAAVLYQAGAHQNALAALVTEKLCQQRIPGAKWAKSFACGSIIEGEEEKRSMMACGMAFSHEKSRRFLRFITDEEAI